MTSADGLRTILPQCQGDRILQGQVLHQRALHRDGRVQRLRDGVVKKRWIAPRRKAHDLHTIGDRGRRVPGEIERQAGFADAARTNDRQQRCICGWRRAADLCRGRHGSFGHFLDDATLALMRLRQTM